MKVGVTSSSSANNFRAKSWSLNSNIDTSKYITFSMSASSGYAFTIDSIKFGIGRSAAGTIYSEWRGSQDNFQTAINEYSNLNANLENNNGVLLNPNANSSWNGNVLSLTNIYNSISSAQFKLYMYGAESGTGTAGLQGDLTIYGTWTINTVLPVTLLNFEGKAFDKLIKLAWNTSNEVNSRGFYVEKSNDGVEWNVIGFIKSNSDSLSHNYISHYIFDDDAPYIGSNYYRLKQIDVNGNYSYSKIIKILDLRTSNVNLYPNPAKNTISFEGVKMPAQVAIYNLNGQCLLSQTISTTIDVQSINNGTYFIKILDADSNFASARISIAR